MGLDNPRPGSTDFHEFLFSSDNWVIEEIEVPPFPKDPRKFNQSAFSIKGERSDVKKRNPFFITKLFDC